MLGCYCLEDRFKKKSYIYRDEIFASTGMVDEYSYNITHMIDDLDLTSSHV